MLNIRLLIVPVVRFKKRVQLVLEVRISRRFYHIFTTRHCLRAPEPFRRLPVCSLSNFNVAVSI